MAYEQLIIVGHLGRDPEARYTPQGTLVVNFSVAVNRYKRDSDNETIWYRVTAWEKTAEIANDYLSKGDQVMIVGQLQADPSTGGPRIFERNDGTPGANFEMTAHRVVLLGGKKGRREEGDEEEVESVF